jgi:hypothetical protein
MQFGGLLTYSGRISITELPSRDRISIFAEFDFSGIIRPGDEAGMWGCRGKGGELED